MKNKLVELRKEAEQSVSDMKDGPLKVKAFETILEHLLALNADEVAPQTAAKPKAQQKSQTTTTNNPETAPDRILSLKEAGFFKSQRSIAEIRQELRRNGWNYEVTSLSGPLQSLVSKRALRRENVEGENGKKAWKYSNP
jgi:hypothetical protein